MLRFLFIGPEACRSSLLTLVRSRFSKVMISTTDDLDDGLFFLEQDRFIDLVLSDSGPCGARATERLKAFCARHPGIRFAVMSDLDSRESVFSSLAGGLHGVVSKRQSDDDIVAALKVILSGGTYVPWSSVKAAGSPPQPPQIDMRGGDARLTPRQEQVLRLLSLGMSNKEIARALHIAESTTKIHTSMLMRAMRVRNRTEAAFKAGNILAVANASAGVDSAGYMAPAPQSQAT